ncbi:MAG TPA: sugar phosphate isomerase/epimerase family protein [Tepidisphaeraceae bacterium]|nr:sugar phosphate isomerase/epimerase family protein [Tepidisphaeraceae bacterium]
MAAKGAGVAAMWGTGLLDAAEAQAISQPAHEPMALGLVIKPFPDPEKKIALVHELGLPTCFLSLDGYLGRFTPALASQFRDLLQRYKVVATTVEVVNPPPLKWDFMDGPATIGIVPRATRTARMDALKQTSDFAKLLGIGRVQTHCGFIPEDPKEPLYEEAVLAIRSLTEHCAGNGQSFLMETGQETPTTMLRMIRDVDRRNLGVGLDTANLILYGKANPVDALKLIGPYVQAMHAKDGKWPTDPSRLGEEVVIGKGEVDFAKVLGGLHALGYKGAVTIERETSGPQQIADIRAEKQYLERILAQIRTT